MWEAFIHKSSVLCSPFGWVGDASVGDCRLEDLTRWLSSINCAGFGWGSRRMRVRRMGMEAAMMELAGSAVPKMKRSTLVAVAGLVSD